MCRGVTPLHPSVRVRFVLSFFTVSRSRSERRGRTGWDGRGGGGAAGAEGGQWEEETEGGAALWVC